ncbi:DUF1918 domain-containing protein [Candidatus Bathyarchaeota archaeon]|nr:DUF1918 domain-containing protein [Candidatus Bathyarchaeota archaeon]
MRKLRVGDSVWVATPKLAIERKMGTIVSVERKRKEPRYSVEWETYVLETGKPIKYSARELVSTRSRN